MKQDLTGKWVLITGASSGLGSAIALSCAKQGANLLLLARNIEKLQALQAQLSEQFSCESYFFHCDMTDFNEIIDVSKRIIRTYNIDVLINCAGFGLFETAELTSFPIVESMFSTNVLGLIQLTKQFIPYFTKKKAGHIINIASQAGKLATPKSSVYAATKFAVLGFTNALRLELAPVNVYVTAVNPGPIATPFFKTADRTGKYLENIGSFVLKPEKVAARTVAIIGKKRREVNLPFLMNVAVKLYQISPQLVEFFGKRAFLKK